jgi:predicted phage replisome organizer
LADVKWIKITTDMFDNRKIKHLRRLPEGNNIVLIWVMLLTMAGRCNSNGMIFLTENIPYTHKMLADELDFEENTVKLALTVLEQLNMVVTDKGFFAIAGWEEYQNIEGMEKIREQNRIRQKRWYDNQKALPNVTPNVRITEPNAPDIDRELEKEKEKEKDNRISADLQSVVDLYHSICVSYPRIRSLSDARKKAIKARLKSYSLDDFKTLFQHAEASSFLKGVDGGWKASFDWLIKEANMLKVLEGNYADKPRKYGYKEKVPGWMGFTMGDEEKSFIEQALKDDPATPEEQEQLRRELQESFGRK